MSTASAAPRTINPARVKAWSALATPAATNTPPAPALRVTLWSTEHALILAKFLAELAAYITVTTPVLPISTLLKLCLVWLFMKNQLARMVGL